MNGEQRHGLDMCLEIAMEDSFSEVEEFVYSLLMRRQRSVVAVNTVVSLDVSFCGMFVLIVGGYLQMEAGGPQIRA